MEYASPSSNLTLCPPQEQALSGCQSQRSETVRDLQSKIFYNNKRTPQLLKLLVLPGSLLVLDVDGAPLVSW